MPQYRTNEPVTYVHDGAVVAVAAHRVVDLDESVAKKLGEKVTVVEGPAHALMFPDGAPIIDALRMNPANDRMNVAAEPEVEKVAKGKK